MSTKIIISSILLLVLTTTACKKIVDGPDPTIAEDINLGGETSAEGTFVNAFQQPASNLNLLEIQKHLEADKAFGDIFVTAPSTINGGLGPVFNQNSCESCHISNGKSPFPDSPQDLRGLLVRLSTPGAGIHGEPLPVPNFGGQLQHKAVFGKMPEGKLTWQQIQEIQQYVDGNTVSLRHFDFNIENAYTALPSNVLVSPRIAPSMIGLGLLEAIREQDILALADPNDNNADGISGKPNRVWNYATQQYSLGRFGWKAAQPTLYQQTAAAYNNDMGITNPLFSTESSAGQTQSDGLPDEPEIDDVTLKNATFYTQSLAVPQRRNTQNIDVQKGKMTFQAIQCASCHNPKFTTGTHPEYTFLSNQQIYPYTDMLLHDMGAGLADGRPDYEANGQEWRTPPLWGLGLIKIVGGHSNFLHDGRARNIEEAILWHGGEAENSKNLFKKLTKEQREQVIKFLESL